jgi:hypothetical protein
MTILRLHLRLPPLHLPPPHFPVLLQQRQWQCGRDLAVHLVRYGVHHWVPVREHRSSLAIGKFYAGQSRKRLHDVRVGFHDGFCPREVLREHRSRRLCGGKCVVQQRLQTISAVENKNGPVCRRTGTNIVPVWVIGRELLVCTSFDNVNPSWHLKLARPLEMGCVCSDKGFCTAECHTIRTIPRSQGVERT